MRHPDLPVQVRVSTGAKNARNARVITHLLYRFWIDWITDLEAKDLVTMSEHNLRGWIAVHHPVHGLTVRTTPDDTAETLAEMREFLRMAYGARSHAPGAPPPIAPATAATTGAARGGMSFKPGDLDARHKDLLDRLAASYA